MDYGAEAHARAGSFGAHAACALALRCALWQLLPRMNPGSNSGWPDGWQIFHGYAPWGFSFSPF